MSRLRQVSRGRLHDLRRPILQGNFQPIVVGHTGLDIRIDVLVRIADLFARVLGRGIVDQRPLAVQGQRAVQVEVDDLNFAGRAPVNLDRLVNGCSDRR